MYFKILILFACIAAALSMPEVHNPASETAHEAKEIVDNTIQTVQKVADNLTKTENQDKAIKAVAGLMHDVTKTAKNIIDHLNIKENRDEVEKVIAAVVAHIKSTDPKSLEHQGLLKALLGDIPILNKLINGLI